MRKYEIMLILPPDADESLVAGAVDRVGRVLKDRGGSVVKVDRWGKRRLAYEIRRQSEGFYLIVQSVAEPSAMLELDRVLSLADDVIRFKVVVRGEADETAAGAADAQGLSPAETAAGAEAPAADVSGGELRTGRASAADEPAAREASPS